MSTVEVLLSHDNAHINKDDSDEERGDGFLKTGSRHGGLPRPRSECCFPRMEILAPSPEPGKPAVLSPSQTMTSLHRASIVSTLAPFHPPCLPVSPVGLTLSVTPATPATPAPPPIPKVAGAVQSLSQGSTPLPGSSASGALLGTFKVPAAAVEQLQASQAATGAIQSAGPGGGGHLGQNAGTANAVGAKGGPPSSANAAGVDRKSSQMTAGGQAGGAGSQVGAIREQTQVGAALSAKDAAPSKDVSREPRKASEVCKQDNAGRNGKDKEAGGPNNETAVQQTTLDPKALAGPTGANSGKPTNR